MTTVRTRGETAYLMTACTDGASHRFTITADGQVTDPNHDLDEEAVITALGGAPNPCGAARQAFLAARTALQATTGITDVPRLRHRQRTGYSDGHTCPTCPARPTLQHISSPAHQASRLGAPPAATVTLYRWLLRVDPAAAWLRDPTTGRSAQTRRATAVAAALCPSLPANRRPAIPEYYAASALLSPTYAAAVNTLFPGEQNDLYGWLLQLRGSGISVQWLTSLSTHAHPAALARLVDRYGHAVLLNSLTRARNVAPRTVASYINAGIVAHFHTYARAHVTAAQVLAFYRATGGAQTLADRLAAGASVTQALREVGAA